MESTINIINSNEAIGIDKLHLKNKLNEFDKNDFINPLIKKLTKLINESKNKGEIKILERQLNDLKRINNLYKKYFKKHTTQSTKQKLKDIFGNINSQLNKQDGDVLEDDINQINSLMKQELKKLKDHIDLFGIKTLRDLVNKSVKIPQNISRNIKESFLENFTIEYINELEKQKGKQITNQDIKNIIKRDGIYVINDNMINNILQKLSLYNVSYDFQIEITIVENVDKKTKNKIIKKDLKDYKNYAIPEGYDPIEEAKKIENLFKKYFKADKVNNRADISSFDFLKTLLTAIDNHEISFNEYIKILEYGYYLAFKEEIKYGEGKKGINNIIRYENVIKKIIKQNLKNIIDDSITENLFLLTWIESNGLNKPKNKYGAIGMWQILLTTAQKYDKTTNETILENNPIISTNIATQYLADIIKNIKAPYTNEEKLLIAIQIYNGNLIHRIKEKYRQNYQKTLYQITKELLNVYNMDTNKKNKISQLKIIHDKYYITGNDGNGSYKGKSHFRILDVTEDKYDDNINSWIIGYINIILKQQTMYPIQYNAFMKVYNEEKKSRGL